MEKTETPNKKKLSIPKLIVILIVVLVAIAIAPPIYFLASDSYSSDIFSDTKITELIYDDDYEENFIRYIEFEGKTYQELLPSISTLETYYYSDTIKLEYGKPLAYSLDSDQSLVEKYVLKVFKYPTNPRSIYPVLNDEFKGYISLDKTDLFYPIENIKEKTDYYSDMANYTYYLEDYNSGQIADISMSKDAAVEMIEYTIISENLALDDDINLIIEAVPNIITLEAPSDYEGITINAESKDKLLLKSVGDIYEKDGKIYQIIDEFYNESNGTSTLYAVELSKETSSQLIEIIKTALKA